MEKRPDKDVVYWAKVATLLLQLPQKFQTEGPIAIVQLLGDGVLSGGNGRRETFKDIVMRVIRDSQDKHPVVSDEDPEFAAARGARELALRWIAEHPESSGGSGLLGDRLSGVQIILGG